MFALKLGDGGYVICYEMEDIEKKLGFGRKSLVCYMFYPARVDLIFRNGGSRMESMSNK